MMYYIDKRKAIKHQYRLSEKTLLLSSLLGGCFGGVISMFLFHHKTKHLKFKLLVPLCCIIWLFIIYKKFYI